VLLAAELRGAASLPSSRTISVSSTVSVRPLCSGRVSAVAAPLRIARRKLVFDSTVAVPASANDVRAGLEQLDPELDGERDHLADGDGIDRA
jgi:hypothetical protein